MRRLPWVFSILILLGVMLIAPGVHRRHPSRSG